MVFSSSIFLVWFLPALLLLYFLLPNRFKNVFLLIASIFFYSWGAPKFIFVILFSTFIDFHLVRWMDSASRTSTRRALLVLSLMINLGLLFYFKYSNFFIENFNVLLKLLGVTEVSWVKLILPIGISFYTFETITYVVDVYRKIHKPLKNFWDYQLYIILFPKLIAGPIIRYHDIADQINDRSLNYNSDFRLAGLYRFCIGLGKKVIIANNVGEYADQVFAQDYTGLSSSVAWIGILAYTFQIYFDFSGYSDMAIGIGKMLGFKFPENFNNPYIAKSVTEFWRRWHITLGAWMKNYLYIPLGGNQVNSSARLYLNLWLVFLASGLWHGASWSFIVWGACHGFLLVLERAWLLKWYKNLPIPITVLLTFFLVTNCWVFFRVENIHDAISYLKVMYAFKSEADLSLPDSEFWFIFTCAAVFSFFALSRIGEKVQNGVYFNEYSAPIKITLFLLTSVIFVYSLARITSSDFNPFIYFRF